MYSVFNVILKSRTLLILFKKILPHFNIAFTLLAYVKRNSLWYFIIHVIFLPTVNKGEWSVIKQKNPYIS